MDDESKQLLREMRDLTRQSYESHVAWRKELQANAKRGRIIVFFIILPVLFIFLSICAWGIISSRQAERERNEEERRYHEELQHNREELQRRMEERRNQLMRPKDLGLDGRHSLIIAQTSGTCRPSGI
jgi:hypothetical protein